MARMKVDKLNRQPFGFLSGGASALAENTAGVGSMALCPERICVGINVSGNHVRAVREGDVVTAYAKLQYKGRTLHECIGSTSRTGKANWCLQSMSPTTSYMCHKSRLARSETLPDNGA